VNQHSLRRLRALHRKVLEGDGARAERDVLLWQMSRVEGETQQELADILNGVAERFGGSTMSRNAVQKIVQREERAAENFQASGRT
jgi:hypothetical protein